MVALACSSRSDTTLTGSPAASRSVAWVCSGRAAGTSAAGPPPAAGVPEPPARRTGGSTARGAGGCRRGSRGPARSRGRARPRAPREFPGRRAGRRRCPRRCRPRALAPVFVGPSTNSSPAPLVFTVPTLRRTCSRPASRSTSRQRRTNAFLQRIEARRLTAERRAMVLAMTFTRPNWVPCSRTDRSVPAGSAAPFQARPFRQPPTFGCELFRGRWRLDTLQS
jgi:hypothetical protein